MQLNVVLIGSSRRQLASINRYRRRLGIGWKPDSHEPCFQSKIGRCLWVGSGSRDRSEAARRPSPERHVGLRPTGWFIQSFIAGSR